MGSRVRLSKPISSVRDPFSGPWTWAHASQGLCGSNKSYRNWRNEWYQNQNQITVENYRSRERSYKVYVVASVIWVCTIQTHHLRQCPTKRVACAAESGGSWYIAFQYKSSIISLLSYLFIWESLFYALIPEPDHATRARNQAPPLSGGWSFLSSSCCC